MYSVDFIIFIGGNLLSYLKDNRSHIIMEDVTDGTVDKEG